MPPKKIYIHAGFHKTGTSSIQESLFRHRAELKTINGGYFYSAAFGPNHSVPFFSLFADAPEKYHMNIKSGRVTKEVIHTFNQQNENRLVSEITTSVDENFIISGEDISHLTEQNLKQMKEFLLRHAPNVDIRIILFTREPIRFGASLFQESLKNGFNFSTQTLTQRVNDILHARITKFIHVFGKPNVKLFAYEDACSSNLPLHIFFLQQLGITPKDIEQFIKTESPKENQSACQEIVYILSYINICLPLLIDGAINPNRQQGDILHLIRVRGEKYGLDQDTTNYILQETFANRKWLRNEFGIDYLHEPHFNTEQQLYGYNFCSDIVEVFPNCTPVIQYLIGQYFQFILKQETLHPTHRTSIQQIVDCLETKFPDRIVGTNIDKHIHFQAKYASHQSFRQMESFIKKTNGSTVEPAVFYRELAILCKNHSQNKTALHFMKEAHRFNPNGPFIQKKIKEWENDR